MNHWEQVWGWYVEQRSSRECCYESCEDSTRMSEKYIGNIESYRCCEREEEEPYDLCIFMESWFLEDGCERERNRDLMNRYSEQYTVSESRGYPETRTYSESVEEGVDEDGYPCNERNVIVVLVRILVHMITMLVIMMVSGQELFHEIDDEKTSHEGIYCELTGFEWFC